LNHAGKLDDQTVSTAQVAAAVRGALALVEKAGGKAAADGMECALALTNGRILAVTRHGATVYLQERASLHDCAVCRAPPPRDKRIDHEHLRSVVVVADVDPPTADMKFVEVADRTLLAISHDLKVEKLAI